ncbi:MAG: murein biosynthesis integral membrane protein MurJ [Phycisphaerales bacterium]|nr:murein biosynthesis integral membrane protein MurJ [Phycisphaerales bacterium]
MSKSFHQHARTVAVLTFVSRVTGLAREAVFSRIFGLGPIMDAFSFAFMTPNLFRRLFGEGALSAAFLPRFSKLDRDDPESARRFGALMLAVSGAGFFAILVIAELILLLLWWNAPEFTIEVHPPLHFGGALLPTISVRSAALGYELAMLMMPYMPLVCLVALSGAVLQSKGRFLVTAAAPVILNVAFVIAALAGIPFLGDEVGRRGHIMLVACSVLGAGVLQVLWTLAALRKVGLVFERHHPIARLQVKKTLLESVPVMIGMGVLQINTFVDGLIASWPTLVGPTIFGFEYPLQAGAMAAFANAQRLYEFPLAIFGLSVATAIFPALARESNDLVAFAETMRHGLRRTFFIGLPASIGLFLVAEPACGVVFQGSEFTFEDTQRVAAILRGFSLAIWSYAMVHVVARAFYALDDRQTPLRVAISMLGLNFALNITLIFTPLREAGLAYSTAFCSIVQCVVLMVILRKRVPGIFDASLLTAWMKPMVATLVMAVCVVAVGFVLPQGTDWTTLLVRLLGATAVGAASFLLVARLLRATELRR